MLQVPKLLITINLLNPSVSHKCASRKTRTQHPSVLMKEISCAKLKKSEYCRLLLRNRFPSLCVSLACSHHFWCHVRLPHPATSNCLPSLPLGAPLGRRNHSKCSDLHCPISSSSLFICQSVFCLFIHLFLSWAPLEICGWWWFVWCKKAFAMGFWSKFHVTKSMKGWNEVSVKRSQRLLWKIKFHLSVLWL